MNMQASLGRASSKERFQRYITRQSMGEVTVLGFDLPSEYVLGPWGSAFRSTAWMLGSDALVRTVQLERYIPPVQVTADPIQVRLVNFGRFRGNLQVVRFGFERRWTPLGPRESVGIVNYLPSLAQDLQVEKMRIASPLRSYVDVDGRDRALEVIATADYMRTLRVPLLNYGWAKDRWFPFAPAEDIAALRELAFPPPCQVISFPQRKAA